MTKNMASGHFSSFSFVSSHFTAKLHRLHKYVDFWLIVFKLFVFWQIVIASLYSSQLFLNMFIFTKLTKKFLC
jgi:hypothetical protein